MWRPDEHQPEEKKGEKLETEDFLSKFIALKPVTVFLLV